MASLFLSVEEALAPLRERAAAALGETPAVVAVATGMLAAGTVECLIALGSTRNGAVLAAVRNADPGLLADASPLLATSWTDGYGETRVLSDHVGKLARATAARSEVRVASADALLGLVEPVVLAAVCASGVARDEAGLRSYLRSLEPEATRLSPLSPEVQEATQLSLFDTVEPPHTGRSVWQLWAVVAFLAAVLILGWALLE